VGLQARVAEGSALVRLAPAGVGIGRVWLSAYVRLSFAILLVSERVDVLRTKVVPHAERPERLAAAAWARSLFEEEALVIFCAGHILGRKFTVIWLGGK
jgi:hypothetical protein